MPKNKASGGGGGGGGGGVMGSLFSRISSSSSGSSSSSAAAGGATAGSSKKKDPTTTTTTTDANSITDPRIPLTVRQKFSISKSWKGITRALEVTGVAMFVRMFRETPELLSVFGVRFSTLKTSEQQRTSEDLLNHATIVMSSLDTAISCLDHGDEFVKHCESVGRTHRRIPNFQANFFWKMEQPFLSAVRETLEDRYTDNIENIYKITIKCILETMIRGFDSHGSV